MKVINLDNLEGLPQQFIDELSKWEDNFKDTDYLDDLLELSDFEILIVKIDRFCLHNTIFGYHYTRANPEQIKTNGLLSRKGVEIRETFLDSYSNLFSISELESIKNQWLLNFGHTEQQEIRDNKIFFNFTLKEFGTLGSAPLLKYFGGEQIYWPLHELDGIREKLEGLGIPMIVKCVLKPSELSTFTQFPWGKIAASTYHSLKNQNACRFDQDGYQTTSVSPSNIELIELKNI